MCASCNKLVPSPDHCLNDGYFCFEVKIPAATGKHEYSYQVWPDDPDLLFSIYGVRTSRRGDYCTHAWNMSLDHTIDEAVVYLQFRQMNERHPVIAIEVKKMVEQPVIFNFWRFVNDKWLELARKDMWDRFHGLEMDVHSFKFETTELLDQELGLESKQLVINFNMNVTKVNMTDFGKKIKFTTESDGARYIFGEKSALRPVYQRDEKESAPGVTLVTVVVLSCIASALFLLAVIAILLYKCWF